jgi:WD40 repeat protein
MADKVHITDHRLEESISPACIGRSPSGLLDLQSAAWQRGQPLAIEELVRHQEASDTNTETALDLIHHEVILRHQAGQVPQPADYLSRFPHLARQIERIFDVEQYFNRGYGPNQGASFETSTLRDALATGDGPSPIPSVAGYAIEGVLGRGGMGIVYRARHLGLKRPVALKMIAASAHEEPDVLARFGAEADAVARLEHPNIVHIYDVGESAGRQFLAFELVEGRSLAAVATGAPQPPAEAALLLIKLARAIDYAHDRGVIHRDLKPANVLLTAAGEPKVTDFGLAKQLFADCGQTASGSVLGTPSYMAPEQASGRSRYVGRASDVYGLGAILYELLTGRPPFKAETPLETLRQVTSVEVVPPRRLAPAVPRDLETICLKCLEKEPARRYERAGDLADDLGRFLAGEPVQARPIGRHIRAWRWCGRNPAQAALGATLVIALAAVAVVASVSSLWLRAERNAALEHRDRALIAEKAASDAAHEATEALWWASLDKARVARQSQAPGRRSRALEALAQAAAIRPDPKLRDEMIACLALVDLEPRRTAKHRSDEAAFAVFDSSLSRYALCEENGSVSVHDARDDRALFRITGFDTAAHATEFSPDGRLIAAILTTDRGQSPHLQVWDVSTCRMLVDIPNMGLGALGFSPDGKRLAAAGSKAEPNAVTVFDVATRRAVSRSEFNATPTQVQFGPDGKQLAIVTRQAPMVRIVDAASGRIVATMPESTRVNRTIWHPAMRTLVVAADAGQVYYWWFDRPDPKRALGPPLGGQRDRVLDVVLDPTGHWLVSIGADGNFLMSDFHSLELLVSLQANQLRSPERLRFGARGAHPCVWLEGCAHETWELVDDQIYIERHATGAVVLAFSQNGRLMATTGSSGMLLWDAETTLPVPMPHIPKREVICFSPDGRGILLGGPKGLELWTIEKDPAGRVMLGAKPSRELHLGGHPNSLDFDPARHLLAVTQPDGQALIFKLERPEAALVLKGPPGLRGISIDPKGRWVATGTWDNPQGACTVWDAQTGRSVINLPGANATPLFSPDGELLAIGSGEDYRIYRSGSWRFIHSIPQQSASKDLSGPLAFSPDGGMLATTTDDDRTVRLVDPTNAVVLATLRARKGGTIETMGFSPDGRWLCILRSNWLVEFWDIRQLRKRLADVGLDWSISREAASLESRQRDSDAEFASGEHR